MLRILALVAAVLASVSAAFSAQWSVWVPDSPYYAPALADASLSSSLVIDATGEKIALIGHMWNASGTTKSVRKLHFRFGAVTKAGGSGLTVSLQDVSTSAGPPTQPDGTQDQTVAIANGDANFASDTWYSTGNLSADRSVAYGEQFAVVIEFDGSGRLGSDSVVVAGISTNGSSAASTSSLYTASWASVGAGPGVLLEFSDGTFGSFENSYPISSAGTNDFASNSTPDESAIKFQVPFNCQADGAWVRAWMRSNTRSFDVVLYQDTTALATVSIDGNTIVSDYNTGYLVTFPAVSLTTGNTYYLSVKPTTTNTVATFYMTFADATYLAAVPGGTTATYATRTDAGSWSETTTRRMYGGIRCYPSTTGGAHVVGG